MSHPGKIKTCLCNSYLWILKNKRLFDTKRTLNIFSKIRISLMKLLTIFLTGCIHPSISSPVFE